LEQQFKDFIIKYNKNYETKEEYELRFQIFQDNLIRAFERQNKEKLNGAHFGITKFSDLTPKEFTEKRLTFDSKVFDDVSKFSSYPSQIENNANRKFNPNPTNWDWSAEGACTPVFDQGQCGSSSIFSSVETIESYYFLAGNPLTPLAMEQIMYCDGTEGCDGGYFTTVYNYVENCGLSAGPYVGESCNYKVNNMIVGMSTYVNITEGEPGLYKQLSAPNTGGPINVCLDASQWQFYTGGVLTSCTDNVDDCVQLVGYAKYGKSGAYWIVRQSWGEDWGENGFIWIEIGSNLCGIADFPTYPVISAPPKNPPSWCSGSS